MEKGRISRSKTRTGKRSFSLESTKSMHQHHGVDKMDTAEDTMQADSDEEFHAQTKKRFRSMSKTVKVKFLTPKEHMTSDQPGRLENYHHREIDEKFHREESVDKFKDRVMDSNEIDKNAMLCKSSKGGQLVPLKFIIKNFDEFFDENHLGKKGRLYVVQPYGTQLVPPTELATEAMPASQLLQHEPETGSFPARMVEMAKEMLTSIHIRLPSENKRLALDLYNALPDVSSWNAESYNAQHENVKNISADIMKLYGENDLKKLQKKLDECLELLGSDNSGQEHPSPVINLITNIGDNITAKDQEAKADSKPPPGEQKPCVRGNPHTVEEDGHSHSVEESSDRHPDENTDSYPPTERRLPATREGKVWEGPARQSVLTVETTDEKYPPGKLNPLSPSTISKFDEMEIISEPPTPNRHDEGDAMFDHSYSQSVMQDTKNRLNAPDKEDSPSFNCVGDEAYSKAVDELFPGLLDSEVTT